MQKNCFILIFAFAVGWARPDASHLTNHQYLPPLQSNSINSYGNIDTTNQAPLSGSSGTNFAIASKNPTYFIHPQIESIRPSIQVASFTVRTEVPLTQSYSQTQQTQPTQTNQIPNRNSYYTNAISQAASSHSTTANKNIPVTYQQNLVQQSYSAPQTLSSQNALSQNQAYSTTIPNTKHTEQHNASTNILKQTYSAPIESYQRSSLPSAMVQQTNRAPVQNNILNVPQSASMQSFIPEQKPLSVPAQENRAFIAPVFSAEPYLPPVQNQQNLPQIFKHQSYTVQEPEKGNNAYTEIIDEELFPPEIDSHAHSFVPSAQYSMQNLVANQETYVYPKVNQQYELPVTAKQNNLPSTIEKSTQSTTYQQPPQPSLPVGYAPALPNYDTFAINSLPSDQQSNNGQNQYLPPLPSQPLATFQISSQQPYKTSASSQPTSVQAQQTYSQPQISNYIQEPYLPPPISTTQESLTSPQQKYSTADVGQTQRSTQAQQFHSPSSPITQFNGYNHHSYSSTQNVQNSFIATQERSQTKHTPATQQTLPVKTEVPYQHNRTTKQQSAPQRFVENVSTPLKQHQQISSPLPEPNKDKALTTAHNRNNAPTHFPKLQPHLSSHQGSFKYEVPKRVQPTLSSNLRSQSAYSYNESSGGSNIPKRGQSLLPNNIQHQSIQKNVTNQQISFRSLSSSDNYKPRLTVPVQHQSAVQSSVPQATISHQTYDSDLQARSYEDRMSIPTTAQPSQAQNSPIHTKWSSFLPNSEVQPQNEYNYKAQSGVQDFENQLDDNKNHRDLQKPATVQPEEKTSLIGDSNATQSPRSSKTEYATSNGYIYYRY